MSQLRILNLRVLYVLIGLLFCQYAYAIVRPAIVEADSHFAILWARSFVQIFGSGVSLPRWLDQSYASLGSPTFYFYPSLTYYLTAPVWYLLDSWMSGAHSYLACGLLFTLLSGATFCFLLRSLKFTLQWQVIASLVWMVMPFRIYTLFHMGGLSSHAAFCWIPLAFAGWYGLASNDSTLRTSAAFVLLVLGTALLFLTNLPFALVTGLGMSVLWLDLAFKHAWSKAALCAFAAICGVGMTAFHYFPVAYFRDFVQLDKFWFTRGDIGDILDFIPNLFYRVDITENLYYLAAYVSIVCTTLYVLSRWRTAKLDTLTRSLLFLCLTILLFEHTFVSQPLWKHSGLDRTIQFPWRWNLLAVFVVTLVWARAESTGQARFLRSVIVFSLLASIGMLTLLDFDIRVHPRAPERTPYDPPEYASVFAPSDPGQVIKIATDHANDPFIQSQRPLRSDESISVQSRTPTADRFAATLDSASTITFHRWYWPTWVLREAGSGVVIPQSHDSIGRATAQLPPGAHTYSTTLERHWTEIAGGWISLVSLLLTIIAGVWIHSRKTTRGSTS